jgi:hypothetical protein
MEKYLIGIPLLNDMEDDLSKTKRWWRVQEDFHNEDGDDGNQQKGQKFCAFLRQHKMQSDF